MPNTQNIRPRRSLLFVPAARLEMFPKAVKAGPDVICIDLEDAVALQKKEQARADCMNMLSAQPDMGKSEILVRVNGLGTRQGLADMLALLDCKAPPDGVMLPKVGSAAEIKMLDELLESEGSALHIHLLIETNAGLEACHEITKSSPRLDSILFGGIDMAAELRVEPIWDALFYARTRLVHAAASAGIDLIDAPRLDLEDMAGLELEASRSAALGMTGKSAIHPKQLPAIQQAFTPSADEIETARRVLAAFDEAGGGLAVLDGKMIEKPVLVSMRRILAIKEMLEE
ncbi:MAG: CoA ester lyase [Rhodospirillales bacterium]|nr:CoA ester lyase [Rhodospirillales bacterium]